MSVEGAYRAEDYVFIQAWGVLMRSSPAYIKAQQAFAAAEQAPLDPLFKHYGSDRWVVLSEMTSRLRERIERLA